MSNMLHDHTTQIKALHLEVSISWSLQGNKTTPQQLEEIIIPNM